MKNVFIALLLVGGLLSHSQAQQADGFSFEYVVLDLDGDPIGNSMVDLQLTFLDGPAGNIVLQKEFISIPTDEHGVARLFVETDGTMLHEELSSTELIERIQIRVLSASEAVNSGFSARRKAIQQQSQSSPWNEKGIKAYSHQ